MSRLEIRGAQVLTLVPGREPIPDGLIAVEDGEIRYAGPTAAAPALPGPVEVIDAAGCVALPGLVNAHTHCAMTLLRGYADDMDLHPWLEQKIWPIEMRLTAQDVYWGVMLGAVEMLRAGVTCFSDMYHYFEAGTKAAIDSGIRACPSGVLLGFLDTAEDDLKKALEFTARLAADGPARVTPMLGPHAPYTCPDRLLRKVAEGAAEQGIPIHIHLSETEVEVEESRSQHGASPVKHLDDLGLFAGPVCAAHCVWLSDEDMDLLAARRVGVAHCPGSNLKLASGIAPLPQLLARGVVVGLGTDGAASNNNLDLLEEARLAALIHKVAHRDPKLVTADEALALATRGSAAALGLDDRIGTLEPGKRADIAVFEFGGAHLVPNHHTVSDLIYSARAGDVKHTVVDGVVVMRDRQLVHLDEAEILAEARRSARRLVNGV